MATLGELLFYIATQQQDSGAGSVADVSAAWGISSATTGGVVRLLRPGEDEICQHYAVKTIENICSQGGEWAATFSTMVRLGHRCACCVCEPLCCASAYACVCACLVGGRRLTRRGWAGREGGDGDCQGWG
jgi:hypothetical protein